MAKSKAALCSSEEVEQIQLFRWAAWAAEAYDLPELELLHHIPNGGKRSKAEAGRFKAAGVKAGVPDICLPVARDVLHAEGERLESHGLYIELKRENGGTVSREQREWIRRLRAQGYAVEVCRGSEAAIDVIWAYLEGRYEPIYGVK